MTLIGAAGGGSYDDFLAAYDPSHANDTSTSGSTLLLEALGNTDPQARLAIANRLLDDGADASASLPSGVNALHILFGARNHAFAAEAQLARRLIDGGADVNAVAARFGTPLQVLARNFAISDADYAPLYDVLFSRPDLDLTSPKSNKKPVLEILRAMAKQRPELLQRAEGYLQQQNQQQ